MKKLFLSTILFSVVICQPQIGDECTANNGSPGFYDYEMCCWPSEPDWLGDGYCDYIGGCGWEGPLYNCPELGFDCGDCDPNWDGTDPLGFCNECTVIGDANLDWNVNVIDVVIMVDCILGHCWEWVSECEFWAMDVNGDDHISVTDLVMIVNIILDG